MRVDGPGDELFARAAFAGDEDRRSAGRRLDDQVDDDGIEGDGLRELDPFGAAGGDADGVTLAREQRFENLAHDLFVVDDENGTVASHSAYLRRQWAARASRSAGASGKRSVNRVP